MRLSDRALVKAIAENPYYQYFIGLQKFTPKCPFTAPALVSFRKRLTADALVKFNEICLRGQASTPEHRKERPEASENGENVGTMILDATASPSNIRFPQDFSLLNEAREKTDCMIDLLHKQIREKLQSPNVPGSAAQCLSECGEIEKADGQSCPVFDPQAVMCRQAESSVCGFVSCPGRNSASERFDESGHDPSALPSAERDV